MSGAITDEQRAYLRQLCGHLENTDNSLIDAEIDYAVALWDNRQKTDRDWPLIGRFAWESWRHRVNSDKPKPHAGQIFGAPP